MAGRLGSGDETEARFAREREQMVAHHIAARGIDAPRVLAAMRKAPRHRFCRPPGRPDAYADHPLDIGEGQTISQPYMVALMTQELRLAGPERVLEIGTGSGYQTAILAELAAEVVSVERIPLLAERARETLAAQGYGNVRICVGDGTVGWPDGAPYNRILVTAGAPDVPAALTEQLADGGILVAPVGDRHVQVLTTVTREGGQLHRQAGPACVFVRLIGEQGWSEG